ncbi:histone H1.01-like [Ranitomeya variabilis]|uniref:histone H1.01-like n=1 Tax=Ranitomeya variabilis TaxID=490064 RepID=UPI0040577C6E
MLRTVQLSSQSVRSKPVHITGASSSCLSVFLTGDICVLVPQHMMAETAPAAAPPPAELAAKSKKQPKKSAAKKSNKPSGPSVSELIVTAVSASKERSGVSLAALKKALSAGGYDVEKNNSRLKLAVKSLVTKGALLQVKGSGASGSFKLNKKQETKDKVAKKKSAAAAKPKKPAAKKAAKSPKKPKKAPTAAKKSPKKAKKPAAAKKAAKSPKKPKTTPKPKKVRKSPAKKAAKPKAAKSPAKKAAKAKKPAAKK